MMQEFRNRIESFAQKKWQEYPQQGIESNQNGPPFDDDRDKTPVVGHPHHTYQMVTANIGRHNTPPDHIPGQFITRQKIVPFGLLFSPGSINSQSDHRQEISTKNYNVEESQIEVHGVLLRLRMISQTWLVSCSKDPLAKGVCHTAYISS